MSTTGERIRELRLRNNLTLDDVAKYLGVGRQAIYKYEHGTVTNIPLDNLEKMAELFGVTPGYLSGWSMSRPDSVPVQQEIITTSEARILAHGVDQLPEEERKKALAVVQAMFSQYADYFQKGEEK